VSRDRVGNLHIHCSYVVCRERRDGAELCRVTESVIYIYTVVTSCVVSDVTEQSRVA